MIDTEGAASFHEHVDEDGLPVRIASYAADDIALAALMARQPSQAESCNACDAPIDGEPAGRGLFMWARGEDLQFDEPPLCPKCATAIGISALRHWEMEES